MNDIGDPMPGMTWCQTCGGDVARKALQCPHCGKQRPEGLPNALKAGVWVFVVLLGLLVIRLVFVVMIIRSSQRSGF